MTCAEVAGVIRQTFRNRQPKTTLALPDVQVLTVTIGGDIFVVTVAAMRPEDRRISMSGRPVSRGRDLREV